MTLDDTRDQMIQLKGAKCVAYAAGVSEKTIKRWVRSGKLQATKPGGRTSPYRVNVSDLDRVLGRSRD